MLKLSSVNKSFHGVPVLKRVSFTANNGEVHALMGQNGAGKSTLMKILSGVYSLDEGEISINDKVVTIRSPKDAEDSGISIVYQELSTLPHLTVAQNIMIGREPLTKFGFLDKKALNEMAEIQLKRLGVDINPNARMGDLPVSQQQLCEIAKAISRNPKIIILDEPTASLTKVERDGLFNVIKKMKEDQFIIIFISHHLEEIYEISDRCTVLRDGEVVYTGLLENVDKNELVHLMVGHSVEEFYPVRSGFTTNRLALELRGFGGGRVHPIDLKVHYGEIVGLSGLVGCGHSNLARMIFGAEKADHGMLLVNGEEVAIKTPFHALQSGIAFISDDRRTDAISLKLSILQNITLPSLILGRNGLSKGRFIRAKNEQQFVENLADQLQIKCSSVDEQVISLSGGNQQKTSIAKWIETGCKIYIFAEPTKGIDVAAKVEVYRLINHLADQGAAVIMISSYNPELIGVCDRILVMSRGRITAEFGTERTEPELVLAQSL